MMRIPEGYAQVNLRFTGTGLPTGAEVVFGVDNEGSADTPANIASDVATVYNANIVPLCSTHVTLTEILVKLGPNATGPAAVVGFGLTGTLNLGDVLPSSALLVRKNTPFGGRTGRGRNYWPILGEDAIGNGGLLTGSAQVNLQTAFTNFLAGLVSAEHPMVLLHGDSVALTPPYTVSSLSVQSLVATQRRRLRR